MTAQEGPRGVPVSAQEWKPGQRVYVLAEVDEDMGNVVDVKIAHPCTDSTHVTTWAAGLRPVPEGDVIERVRDLFALYGVDRGQASDLVREFMDRGLLAGGVPGRSEGEVKAEAWDEALEHAWQLADPISTVSTEGDMSVCTAGDLVQARRENPYRADQVTDTEGRDRP